MTKALVLSGGEIKGAFQAGAIEALADHGWVPDFVVGTSVGALNALFLTAASAEAEGDADARWSYAAAALTTTWFGRVRTPRDLCRSRGVLAWGMDLLKRRWQGVYDLTPLRKLVEEVVRQPQLAQASLRGYSVRVCLADGSLIVDALHGTDRAAIDYAFASAMMPILMPPVPSGDGRDWYDGGVRDIAPLKHAIDRGADEIVVIATTPTDAKPHHGKSLVDLVTATLGTLTHEILRNDLALCEQITTDLLLAGVTGDTVGESAVPAHRPIRLTVVRPRAYFTVNIGNFTADDIRAMWEHGWEAATAAITPPRKSTHG